MGNEFEELSLLDNAFEYCEKNGINIILNCGDFIDGKSSNYNQIITDAYHQIEYFLDNYPKSDSIITFGVGGNHDYSIHNKFDIQRALDLAGYSLTNISDTNFVKWTLNKSPIAESLNVTCPTKRKEVNRFIIFTEYSLKSLCLCNMLRYILEKDSNFIKVY
jgi:predicted MPP superfamily phosphohydrolase